MKYSANLLLDLLRTSRKVVDDAPDEEVSAFHNMLASLIVHEQAQTQLSVLATLAEHGVLRSNDGFRRLTADSALAATAQTEDGDTLNITINAEHAPEGLSLIVAIESMQRQSDWVGATVTIYGAGIIQDFATTDDVGECQLGPFATGVITVEVITISGTKVTLPEIELVV